MSEVSGSSASAPIDISTVSFHTDLVRPAKDEPQPVDGYFAATTTTAPTEAQASAGIWSRYLPAMTEASESTTTAKPADTSSSLLTRVFPGAASPLVLGAMIVTGLAGCQGDVTFIPEEEKNHVVVDYIEQPEQITDLDIWVVLDTSCSMDDNYDEVGSGMLTLQEDIDGLVDDSQFTFMNMDPTTPDVIGPYDSSQTMEIAMAPSVLVQQYTDEAGYAAAYLAYTATPELTRADASLLVFFISDEEEQSGITTPIFHDEFLTNIKDEGKLDVVTIGLLPTNDGECVTDSSGNLVSAGYDAPACKYIDLVERYYNKDAVDLLSTGWGDWLAGASFLTALSTEIALTQTPIEESIVVYRNHDALPYGDWEYDAELNVVNLNFTPDYEDVIAVGYDVNDSD